MDINLASPKLAKHVLRHWWVLRLLPTGSSLGKYTRDDFEVRKRRSRQVLWKTPEESLALHVMRNQNLNKVRETTTLIRSNAVNIINPDHHLILLSWTIVSIGDEQSERACEWRKWAVFALLFLPKRPRLDCPVSGLVYTVHKNLPLKGGSAP